MQIVDGAPLSTAELEHILGTFPLIEGDLKARVLARFNSFH